MKRLSFIFAVCVIALVSIGPVTQHSKLQTSSVAQPGVVVYHDNVIPPAQDGRPANERYWTLAVRSDGSSMRASGTPDAAGKIDSVRDVEFTDHYVVIDPHTKSTTTYKPYRLLVSTKSGCNGSRADSIIGHPTEYVKIQKGGAVIERWVAANFNCLVLREHIVDTGKDGKVTNVYREAVSVKLGDPPAEFFDIPSGYQERGPAELNEVAAASSSPKPFCNDQAVEKLQQVYEAEKLK